MVRANVGLCVIAEWIVPTVNSAPLANGTEQYCPLGLLADHVSLTIQIPPYGSLTNGPYLIQTYCQGCPQHILGSQSPMRRPLYEVGAVLAGLHIGWFSGCSIRKFSPFSHIASYQSPSPAVFRYLCHDPSCVPPSRGYPTARLADTLSPLALCHATCGHAQRDVTALNTVAVYRLALTASPGLQPSSTFVF